MLLLGMVLTCVQKIESIAYNIAVSDLIKLVNITGLSGYSLKLSLALLG